MDRVPLSDRLKFLGSIAWRTGLPWGATMAVLLGVFTWAFKGWEAGLLAGVLVFVLGGAAFGIAMAALLGGLAIFSTRKLGSDGLTVRPTKSLAVLGAPNAVVGAVRAVLSGLPRAATDSLHVADDISVVKTNTSWRSFGETVTVRVEPMDDQRCRVEITSVPKVSTTMVDYGANLKNVQAVIESLQSHGLETSDLEEPTKVG